MPTLHEAVVNEIRAYPSLYRCRTDVLHQFFCVNGNGMRWLNGELTALSVVRDLDEMLREREAESADRLNRLPTNLPGYEQHQARMRLSDARQSMELRFRVEHADDLAMISWTHLSGDDEDPFDLKSPYKATPIFSLCQYACMAEVPDDVKPDWLAGVREMILEVFAAPMRRPTRLHSAESCEQEYRENIAFADIVLRSLHKRFGSAEGEVRCWTEYVDQQKAKAKRVASFFRSLR